jgi:hypothetical protein
MARDDPLPRCESRGDGGAKGENFGVEIQYDGTSRAALLERALFESAAIKRVVALAH